MDTRATVLANIAANVRRTRERRGLTQEQLAERCGRNFRYIPRVERAELKDGDSIRLGDYQFQFALSERTD